MHILNGLLGLVVMLGLAVALSKHRRRIDWPMVGWGMGLQLVFALLVLGVPAVGWHGPLQFVFDGANRVVVSLLQCSAEGAQFVFGILSQTGFEFNSSEPIKRMGFIFAFQVLPAIIFFSTLINMLYHIGLMQRVINVFAVVMHKLMRTSGAESTCVASNVFIGQVEALLVVKPFLKRMTDSELLTLMVGGMATVAGSMMAAYTSLLVERIPDIAGHLLTASVMSAPAALAISKILWPETERTETAHHVPKGAKLSSSHNIIHAAAQGSYEGLHIALNVGAMLVAAVAVISLLNIMLGGVGSLIGFEHWGAGLLPPQMHAEVPKLSLAVVSGWLFAPLAMLLGIPWNEAAIAGSLLGEKIVFNEYVAYLELVQYMPELSDRTVIILSYALCGFANMCSITILIEGIRPLAAERCKDFARLGWRALVGGSLAAFLTACIAGLLI